MKNKVKYILPVMLLYQSAVFSASDTTKQLINKYLAKYGITSNKQDCNTGKEPEYIHHTGKVKCKNHLSVSVLMLFLIHHTGKVKCKNDKQDDTNNCWDADSRLCKECPDKMVVSQRDHTTCRQIVCPEGYELIEVKDDKCPEGFELEPVSSCDENFDFYNEIQATNNYTTTSINCKNINVN